VLAESSRRSRSGGVVGTEAMASTLVLSLGVAATGALSASAYGGPAGISARDAQHVAGSFQRTNSRYFGYAGPGAKSERLSPT
jgi:hypothetical protein